MHAFAYVTTLAGGSAKLDFWQHETSSKKSVERVLCWAQILLDVE